MATGTNTPVLGQDQPGQVLGTTQVRIRERAAWQVDGFVGLAVAILLGALGIWAFVLSETEASVAAAVFGVLASIAAMLILGSLTIIQPGQTRVIQFFGRYVGTARRTGLVWLLPLTTRRDVSVRVRNFETARLKVNDATGNPVEIAAIVVWQVADTARATFAVERYDDFITMQAEAAVRHVAVAYPYDGPSGEESLRGSTDLVSAELASEVAARVGVAGLEIIEVRISHLAYAPEIAQAMLQRQQAAAVVAARSKIVEGAVGMVQMALDELNRQSIVELDEERKAAMVSNLLVVLCGDSRATPVVNTGTLYQ
ncbi:MAG: SPFH domain-containing protein [Actinomycetales bacterium]|nr:SPFH domain-containing protein [Actinomycetales bacterium]